MESLNAKASRLWAARLACLVAGLTLLGEFVEAQDTLKGAQATIHASPSYLHVGVADNLVTVKTRDVAVHDLLEEIARHIGLAVVSHDSLDERITMEFHRLPLPEALGRVLRRQSFALEYAQPIYSAGKSSYRLPSRLWVFSKEPGVVPDNDKNGRPSSSNITSAIGVLRAELMSEDPRLRQAAVERLGALGVVEAVVPLSLALADEDEYVREAAIAAVADIGGNEAARALAIALQDEDPLLREEAVDALGEIGGETAIHVLEQAFRDGEEDVREAAIAAVADIGGNEAALALAIALQDEDASLREQAVDALGEIGSETAIRVLEQAVADHDRSVRDAATETLAELRSQNH
jgi:hypothetical protein